MKVKPLPTKEELDKKYLYDPITGVLISRHRGSECKAENHKGYRVVRIDRKEYMAHRVIWVMMTGEDPCELEIDHENRVKNDNRFINLRLATHGDNQRNKNTRGITKTKGKWKARVQRNGKNILDKYFDTEQEALDAVAKCKAD
jgi:hypothetical protein